MTITAYGTGAYRAAKPQSFTSTRAELTDLERQLATQKKAESYGDLGIDRRTSLDINAKLSTLESWLGGIQRGDVNLKIATQAVETFAKLTSETRTDSRSNSYVPSSTGRSGPQVLAEEKFKQTIDLLNSDVNGRYLFSGRTSDIEPTAAYSDIMNGVGNQAGLSTLIEERNAADDISGSGHLTVGVTAVPLAATISRVAGIDSGYGFALTDTPGSSSAFAVDASGLPASLSVGLSSQPAVGDKLKLRLTLPDGTSEDLVLTARAAGSTGDPATTFVIGTDEADTAAKLGESLEAALEKEAKTSLRAASTSRTALNFFNYAAETSVAFPNGKSAPDRIPASLADAPVPGTAADTMIWYKGDDARDSARDTASVQVDKGQLVGTGARANEEAFAIGLAQFAVMAIEVFPAGDANSQAGYEEMISRVGDQLGFGDGVQKPAEIITEFGSAQTAMARAKERHESTKNYLTTTLAGVENVTTEEVAVQILALQTRLQASYQTTAILSKLSLTNYL